MARTEVVWGKGARGEDVPMAFWVTGEAPNEHWYPIQVSTGPNGGPVLVAAEALPLPQGAATAAGVTALLNELAKKADLNERQPVSLESVPLPTGASTEATLEAVRVLLAGQAKLADKQPITAEALPLPQGAAAEATLEAVRALLAGQAKGTAANPVVTQLSGSTTAKQTRGVGNDTITYASAVLATQIYNDSGDELALTVNGQAHTVPDRMTYTFRDDANPHTTATVTAIGPWIAVGLK